MRAVATGWVKVSGPVHSSAQAGLGRLGSQLQVVWSQTDPGGKSVRTRLLSSDGNVASVIQPVVTDWLGLTNDPQVIGPATARLAVFAGIRSYAPGDPYVGPAVFSTSSNGLSWTLGAGSLSKTTAAQNAESIAALDANGVPFFAMGGFGTGPIVHRGVDPSMPAALDDIHAGPVDGAAPTSVALARNRTNDDVFVAWYSLGATDPGDAGTFVQRVWPQPNGTLLRAPGSANAAGASVGPGQAVALAERAGGGVWLAYRIGYPTSSRIRLWRVGTTITKDIITGSAADMLCLTGADSGRLWLSWRTTSDHRLHAVRTNKAITRFGPVQHIVQPGGLSTSVWSTACEGSRGPLSLLTNAQTRSGSPALFARHILPVLEVTRSPAKLDKGFVTVTVKDAGDPVNGARVTFRRKTVLTGINGKALVKVGADVPSGRNLITVSKTGYTTATVPVTVT